MIKYIDEFIKLAENKEVSKEEMLTKISFFQHERLIHLLVTLFYALFTIFFFALISVSWIFVIPTVPLFVFLICYILHYFKLENRVQYLYKLYDNLVSKKGKKDWKILFILPKNRDFRQYPSLFGGWLRWNQGV